MSAAAGQAVTSSRWSGAEFRQIGSGEKRRVERGMRQSYHGAADGFGFDPGAGGFEIGKPGPLFGGRQIPVGSVPAVAATADASACPSRSRSARPFRRTVVANWPAELKRK